MKMKTIIVILASLLLTAATLQAIDQNSSMYLRGEKEFLEKQLRTKSSQTGEMAGIATQETGNFSEQYTPVIEASWTAVEEPAPKGFRMHDLVTIQVTEISSSSTNAKTKTEREGSVEFKLTDWIRMTGGDLSSAPQRGGDPAIGGSSKRDFDSKGDISRKDTLTARIQAEVVDVLPNGNLCLEARHTIITDDETTSMTLTGICRSKDVTPANMIISSQIHDLRMQKKHEGMARDATKRSMAQRFLDWVNVF